MIQTFLLLIPVFTALYGILIHLIFAPKSRTFLTAVMFLFVMTLYLFTGSTYSSPMASMRTQVQMFLLTQLVAPSLIPLFMVYASKLRGKHEHTWAGLMFWVLVPAALFTSAVVQHHMIGEEQIELFLKDYFTRGIEAVGSYAGGPLHYFYTWNIVAFNYVMLVEVLILLVYLIRIHIAEGFRLRHIWSFLFQGGRVSPLELTCQTVVPLLLIFSLRIFVRKSYVDSHLWLTFILAFLVTALIFLFSYYALFGAVRLISLSDMRAAFRYNIHGDKELAPSIEEDLEEEEASSHASNPSLAAQLFSPEKVFPEDDSLRARFQHLMVDEQLFLQPSLTLTEVSERLHSNKTYVSKMVNNTYNIGLPELLNTLRVDYAEQYILTHRSARQDEIAKACGFLSASSFNNIFKRVTGMTPKVWEASFRESV